MTHVIFSILKHKQYRAIVIVSKRLNRLQYVSDYFSKETMISVKNLEVVYLEVGAMQSAPEARLPGGILMELLLVILSFIATSNLCLLFA